MAYDEELANRIREQVQGESGLTEKRMFGGLAFLINGNMAVSANRGGGLMVRVDPKHSDDLVDSRGVDRVVMRGREMDGWLSVALARIDTEADLAHWVGIGVGYARSLVPK